jgi:phosphoribosylformylglycinamidine synthase I
MKPSVMILRTAGTNCDGETAHAFELAGAAAERVHVNRLMEDPSLLDAHQILAIPGGFSYGDDIAAGRILANQIAHHLSDAFKRFVESGRPVIGICNGFQVLVKTELLPGALAGRTGQTCTLTNNDCGRFVDRWIHLTAKSPRCIWTKGVEHLEAPVAHGEGKFVPANDDVRKALWDRGQIAFTYAKPDGSGANGEFPHNPNGSAEDIAGVCDESGVVLGLMPHPERFVDPTQHPQWTSRKDTVGAGLQIFRNAVQYVRTGIRAVAV